MSDVKKVLSKKRLNGKDLGRLALANFAIGYINQTLVPSAQKELAVDPDFLQEKLQELGEKDRGIYKNYSGIHAWIADRIIQTIAYFNRASELLTRIISYLEGAYISERYLQIIYSYPLILTEKQYKNLEKEYEKKRKSKPGSSDSEDPDQDQDPSPLDSAPIAIYTPPKRIPDLMIDKRGRFESPDLAPDDLKTHTLDYFVPGKGENLIKSAFEGLIIHICMVIQFNTAMDIMAKALDVKEMKYLKVDMDIMEREIGYYNDLVETMKGTLELTYIYQEKEVVEAKKQALLNFPEIDLSGCKELDPETEAKALEIVKSFNLGTEPYGTVFEELLMPDPLRRILEEADKEMKKEKEAKAPEEGAVDSENQ